MSPGLALQLPVPQRARVHRPTQTPHTPSAKAARHALFRRPDYGQVPAFPIAGRRPNGNWGFAGPLGPR